MTEKKTGRPRTGRVVKIPSGPFKGQLQGILTLADGSTHRTRPFPKGTSHARAKDSTLALQEQAEREGIRRPTVAETPTTAELTDSPMGKWVTAWLADRESRKLSANRDSRTHYLRHIVPVFDQKHVRDWTRDDMRRLSHELDKKVQAEIIAWKTAVNVWATATKMCDDASEHKNAALRCRSDNPADKVRGPERGDAVGEQFLYPSEFVRLIEDPAVPLRWKRVFAVAVYLYARDAELRALLVRDVDLEHETIAITKARHHKTGVIKATKGKRSRTVPIEPAVLPLLASLVEGRDGAELLLDMPYPRTMASGLRRWLTKAGITRHELHHRTPTTRPIRHHDLRATGITWCAVRGDAPPLIMDRAGHADIATTMGYVRTGENQRRGFGEPFPELPSELGVLITSFDRGPLTHRTQTRFSGEGGIRTRGRV